MQSVSTFVHTRPGPESDGEHGYDDNKRQMPLVHDDHTFIIVFTCVLNVLRSGVTRLYMTPQMAYGKSASRLSHLRAH